MYQKKKKIEIFLQIYINKTRNNNKGTHIYAPQREYINK